MRAELVVRLSILVLSLLLVSETVLAGNTQIHLRLGYISGSYTGPQEGSFEIPQAVDIEYEIFRANKRSLFFRSILAMEMESAKPMYSYSGFGYHYYFNSKGMQFQLEDEFVGFSAVPRWRYYFGWDAGVSQAIVKSLGKVLQIVSTMLDLGAHVGTTYQIDPSFSLEAQAGISTGQGFSSVSVVGIHARGVLGVAYQF